jgi:acyl-CoA synthetase (AMP-forming)/AMP-acid ligase II
VVAIVVGTPGPLTVHCRRSRLKQPRRPEFVDELPRNAYGKVLKRELRDRFR